jgi:predicted nuclease of predicted toxin-antitoxin system
MKPLDFPLLADENVNPDVVRALAEEGHPITSVLAEGLGGRTDVEVLRHAHAEGRVVLTHDSDFGALVMGSGEPFTGIIYLRPGHISSAFVLDILRAVASVSTDVEAPFIVVAERKQAAVKIRIRSRVT